MHNYKNLLVWRQSIELSTNIHLIAKTFPQEEKFDICSQINRCSVSIASNIAEGSGRNSNKEFNHFLSISLGSSFELETQLIISKNLKYLDEEKFEKIINDLISIQKMLYKFKQTLKGTGIKGFLNSILWLF